jgi:hypothetical protein
MRKVLASCCLFLVFFSELSHAQIQRGQLAGQDVNTITTAVPFLLIAPDSRAGGMGDAGVASTPDANSIHWNPAKLAFISKDMGASISYTPWLRALVNDINLGYLSAFKRISSRQTIAVSLLYFSLGNITFTDEYGTSIGTYNPNEFAIDAAFSQKLAENVSGGIALRYIRSDLTQGASSGGESTQAGNAVAADVSVYYRDEIEFSGKEALLAFGGNISNLGSKISYTTSGTRDFIPTNLRLGGSLTTELDKYNTFAFNLDINKLLVPTPRVGVKSSDISVASGVFQSFSDAPGGFSEEFKEIIYATGVEYWYDNQFAVRAGYFHEAQTKGNRQFVTLGAGLRYNVFGIDFAYIIPTTSQRSPLENTLRFTLLFDFDGKGKTKTAPDQR